MKIALLGYDTEGRASYDYFAAQGGHELTICDRNPETGVPAGAASVLGEGYLDNLDRFDLLVRTPGLYPGEILAKSPGVAGKITTQTNEFFKASPTRNIIGVTGTKGKGTTSTLITKLLEAAGKHVKLGGNIGVSPLTFLSELTDESWVVLELSNFQLIDLKTSPHIAVCLAVVPEHLNWHKDMDDYVAAKSQLFSHQTANDIAIYFADNDISKQIADHGQGQKLPYFAPPGAVVENDAIVIDGQTICKTDELKLPGAHNWQNVCAAVTALWQVTQDVAVLRSVLTDFGGLPFRIEFRREVHGVRYYNDSFASGVGATIAAYQAIPGKKVMIIGGFDRGLDLSELPETFKQQPEGLRKVMLIGAAAERTKAVFNEHGFDQYIMCNAKDMKTVVEHATMIAHSREGDAVVLSPAFASFDMFKNFEDRGIQFNEAVDAL